MLARPPIVSMLAYLYASVVAAELLWEPTAALAEPQETVSGKSPQQRLEMSATTAPVGIETLNVQWSKLKGPAQHTMLAAVARPRGRGPFPAVLVLHGSHGFAREYVQLAEDLARGGLMAVAVCWFSGGTGRGMRFVTSIGCPEAPPMPRGDTPQARAIVSSLIETVRNLPDVRAGQVGLLGHSRGGGASLHYVLTAGDVEALVLNSAPYTPEFIARASQLRVPVLILHGTADGSDDGGSALTDVTMARRFESALRDSGKNVHVRYYEGGKHNSLFDSPAQRKDELKQMTHFLREVLGGGSDRRTRRDR